MSSNTQILGKSADFSGSMSMSMHTYLAMYEAMLRAWPKETSGYFYANEKGFIEHFLPIQSSRATSGAVTHSHEDVAKTIELFRSRFGKHHNGQMHTHPNMGVFWSGTDLNEQCEQMEMRFASNGVTHFIVMNRTSMLARTVAWTWNEQSGFTTVHGDHTPVVLDTAAKFEKTSSLAKTKTVHHVPSNGHVRSAGKQMHLYDGWDDYLYDNMDWQTLHASGWLSKNAYAQSYEDTVGEFALEWLRSNYESVSRYAGVKERIEAWGTQAEPFTIDMPDGRSFDYNPVERVIVEVNSDGSKGLEFVVDLERNVPSDVALLATYYDPDLLYTAETWMTYPCMKCIDKFTRKNGMSSANLWLLLEFERVSGGSALLESFREHILDEVEKLINTGKEGANDDNSGG